ncbi:response regulator [Ideonella sp. BN130291]|uniref:response regulator n=1 Tax=Ideonella sp. BN130291 TaxID=3112940 RepID=UPI002E263D02|nr:response regulator [Ideonella sp. BN130291]
MAVDDVVKLVQAFANLLSVLVWPALLTFVLIRFGPSLKDFFSSLGEFSFKGAGFEATARRKQEAAAALMAAAVARPDAAATPESTARDAKEAASIVGQVDKRTLRRASGAWALWVDDRPDNNVYERQSLEALGVRFVIAKSTDEALAKMAQQRFDVVISDMARPPDAQAGYTLLETLRAAGNHVPFIIYAGSSAAAHKAEAQRRGALGSTNRASELFAYVLSALKREG